MKNNIENLSEQHNILSLLPYSENAQLVNKHQKLDDLYFIKSVVDFSISALELFMEGQLAAFDAQVGENLCQIRACKILYLANKWLHSPSARSEFAKEIELFQEYKVRLELIIFEWENAIKHSNAFNKSLDGTEHINHFFLRHRLLFDLSDDFIFIIICCFLTHFNIRDNNIPVAINLEYISRELHISKYRSKRLTHKYQQLICKLGCDFIIKIAKELPSELGFMDILPTLYQISDEDRAVLPCYTVSEIIFYHSIKEKIPILLIAHRLTESNAQSSNHVIYFLLTGDKDPTTCTLVPCTPYLSQHCMVVSGEVHYKYDDLKDTLGEYINRILIENPLKLILANTASHPQYSGKRLETLRANPFQMLFPECELTVKTLHEHNLMTMQRFALDSGCSKQNPSLFFLRHIYANTVQDEITKLKNDYMDLTFEAHQVIHS
jgi:hypothetical protein